MHNGSSQNGVGVGSVSNNSIALKSNLKPARMSHQIAQEEYNNLTKELSQ